MRHFLYFLAIGLCFPFTVMGQEFYDLGALKITPESEVNEQMLPSSARIEGGISINGSDFFSNGVHFSLPPDSSAYYYISPSSSYFDVRFRILPEKEHIGKEADILLTAMYIDADSLWQYYINEAMGFSSEATYGFNYYSIINGGQIFLREPKLESTFELPTYSRVRLESEQEIVMYQGMLIPGYLSLNCYYRLVDSDEAVVNNTSLMMMLD